MARPFRSLLAAFLLCTPLFAAAPVANNTTPASAESLAADAIVYRQHILSLANPFMEGRAPGTKGNRVAADYIEWHYKNLGLTPAFPAETVKAADTNTDAADTDRDDPADSDQHDANAGNDPFVSYRQVFKAPASRRPGDTYKLVAQDVTYDVKGRTVTLQPGKDFNIIGHSGSGVATGPLVFVGYSLDVEEKDYSTYPVGADLTGKIVIMFRYEPMDANGKSKWAEEDQPWSAAAAINAKFREAVAHKAAAIILVNPPGAAGAKADRLEDMSYAGSRPQRMPVVMLSRAAASSLIQAADPRHRSLMDLRQEADASGGIVEFAESVPVTVSADIKKQDLMTDNVGAILRGKGKLADQYIVIGSHYDHVGYGYFGSRTGAVGKLHPGADDNASGTSGNLLLAQKLAKAYAVLPDDADARSVLFLAFSAEESGLVGSRYYTKHMIAPAGDHYLMLNMDMIGRLREDSDHKGKLEVGGVGTGEGLQRWSKPYWDGSGLNIKESRIGASNSDHFSFYQMKIPDLFFFTGLHNDYHAPSDTADTINVEGAVKVTDLVFRVALDAAQREEAMPFSDGSKRDQPEDEDAPAAAHAANPHAANPHAAQADEDPADTVRPGRRVRFGIMPGNYNDDEPGVQVGDVMEGLPAARAGLKADDRLMKWDDTALTNVMALQVCMEKATPGQTVKITYLRKGEEHTVDVKLVAPGDEAPR